MPSAAQVRQENEPGSFTCPQCGKTSYNLHDVEHRYCGACHSFIQELSIMKAVFMTEDEIQLAKSLGYVYARRISNARYLAVETLMHGQAYLKLGGDEDPHGSADDVWMYEHLECAVVAAASWDPSPGQRDPYGFWRHPATGRRRPFGNPQSEYVRV